MIFPSSCFPPYMKFPLIQQWFFQPVENDLSATVGGGRWGWRSFSLVGLSSDDCRTESRLRWGMWPAASETGVWEGCTKGTCLNWNPGVDHLLTGKPTYRYWKPTIFNRKYIFRWVDFSLLQLGGGFKHFLFFTPNIGEYEPIILTIIFFRWVGSTTN